MSTDHVLPVRPDYNADPTPDPVVVARVKALESLLLEKGVLASETVDRVADLYEKEVGPRNGARAVARAWTDPDFKQRLLADPVAACAELGIGGMQGEDMVVVENTDEVHNVIVCTLCSCYPWPVLGLPPNWYKYPAYRSRIVKDPRALLRGEFELDVPDEKTIKVWDSSAEVRYWVLPQQPPGTEGLSEEELVELITRDSMIGTGLPRTPDSPAGAR
ncbi:nitrile hydratase subunit alpha [Geodermatophilus ruber]|uniref:nitrile hydratase n=1 Tax=Geodermatophilus ruber TaxID=504800 RepID=A0A1I4BLN9_9ACTN|nr:nitrile hydratase subunit alpha [Geodermatophilus ruber]SFK69764.1 nitrile hydratase [Geodermatophilus ruber]